MRNAHLVACAALASLVLIAIAATADRTSADFTATTTNPGNVFATATVSLSNDKPNANDLVNITDLVPGDTANRTVTITNTGSAPVTYVGSIGATVSTLLWSDAANGLQVVVKRGATTLYSGALKDMWLPASGAVAAGATDTLMFDFTFPSSAGNAFQGLSQDFTVTYTATQLAGSAR